MAIQYEHIEHIEHIDRTQFSVSSSLLSAAEALRLWSSGLPALEALATWAVRSALCALGSEALEALALELWKLWL